MKPWNWFHYIIPGFYRHIKKKEPHFSFVLDPSRTFRFRFEYVETSEKTKLESAEIALGWVPFHESQRKEEKEEQERVKGKREKEREKRGRSEQVDMRQIRENYYSTFNQRKLDGAASLSLAPLQHNYWNCDLQSIAFPLKKLLRCFYFLLVRANSKELFASLKVTLNSTF